MGSHHPARALAGLHASSLTPASADIAARMREATIVHLCCHGVVNEGKIDLALLLGGIMQLNHFLESGNRSQHGEQRELRGRPLVVLSACAVGGFLSTGMTGEQYGFPAGFMAIGARAVVGWLWPVPDSRATIRLMRDFHGRLADLPSSAALPATIAQARNQVSPVLWGSLTHYGV
jgi:CHAT domain-containing protein